MIGLSFFPGITLALLLSGPVSDFEQGHVISGFARIIDGDTMEISSVKIRLNGIAAPERDEPGGSAATNFMRTLTDDETVRCSLNGAKTYDREVGTCWIRAIDVGAALIADGKARDCPRYSDGRYAALETPISRSLPLPEYCRP